MADHVFNGSDLSETFVLGSGSQEVNGGARGDRIISYGDAGEPDPAQTEGAEGRQTAPTGSNVDDVLTAAGSRAAQPPEAREQTFPVPE